MDEQKNVTTSPAADTTGPDDSEPTPERQGELRKAYDANVAAGKPPYAGVKLGTRGELNWIVRERVWKIGEQFESFGERPDLREMALTGNFSNVDLSGANLSATVLNEADFSHADMSFTNLSGASGNDATT